MDRFAKFPTTWLSGLSTTTVFKSVEEVSKCSYLFAADKITLFVVFYRFRMDEIGYVANKRLVYILLLR